MFNSDSYRSFSILISWLSYTHLGRIRSNRQHDKLSSINDFYIFIESACLNLSILRKIVNERLDNGDYDCEGYYFDLIEQMEMRVGVIIGSLYIGQLTDPVRYIKNSGSRYDDGSVIERIFYAGVMVNDRNKFKSEDVYFLEQFARIYIDELAVPAIEGILKIFTDEIVLKKIK